MDCKRKKEQEVWTNHQSSKQDKRCWTRGGNVNNGHW